MKSIQGLFPSRKILLNPGPATTSDEVKFAMVKSDICPREEEFCRVLDSVKKDLVKVVNGQDNYTAVLFASSGTGGVEAAVTSLVPKGEKILIIENGVYGARMLEIAQTYGIDVVHYKVPYTSVPDLDEIRNLLKGDPKISRIGIIDHETTTGIRNPIQEISDIASEFGVELIVDCMSSYAGLEIDLKKWKVGAIISSSNKCIQGMAGLSFVITRNDLLKASKNVRRSFYHDLYSQHIGFNLSGQMQFTPPVQIVYALQKALDLFFKEGAENRIKRYEENFRILESGLAKLGFTFLVPAQLRSNILLTINEPINKGYSFKSMHDFLYERGYTIYPGKISKYNTFRLSVLGDLYPADVFSFLETLSLYLKEIGVNKIENKL